MKVSVRKTEKITSRSHDLFELLDAAVPILSSGSVVAIAAKVVSLCEGRTVPVGQADKDELIAQEAQRYMPRTGKYGLSFTIKRNILVASAGVDESNGDDQYVLWPKDLQQSANAIRQHLMQHHNLQHVGVVITDSALRPLQWGTTGIAIAYSGFAPLKDYIGQPDVFGRVMEYHKSNIANGLAAAAVTLMGEGNERTPIAVLEDLDFVEFRDENPAPEELAALTIEPEDDMFWPLLRNGNWLAGKGK